MNNLSCTCGCGCPYTNYRDQKNKAYDAEFVATLVSKTPKDHWHNEMYLTIFKNGLVMDGVKYKESIYSPNGCPIVQAIPKSHQKSIKRHVISLNDAAFRDIKTLVRKLQSRSSQGVSSAALRVPSTVCRYFGPSSERRKPNSLQARARRSTTRS
eukprot:GHVH01000352.1.p1 GENE.GHVH01000352.1~~GHVH01000352.1.p1  ORF type:complete len:165 (+),score=3.47 GHVH01000352.1:33-497(+)